MRNHITAACIWIISKINKHKDRNLSQVLSELAKDYDPEWVLELDPNDIITHIYSDKNGIVTIREDIVYVADIHGNIIFTDTL